MPPRKGTTQQAKVVTKNQCGSCNEIFAGKICPNCGEKVAIFPINADGISTDEVASAIGATHGLPINLARSPDIFDVDDVVDTARKQQMKDVIQEANLDKVRAMAADQATKRLRAEKELEATEKGFIPPQDVEGQSQQGGMSDMSSAMFMQALGGWNPEARETLFDRLKADPEFAFNLSRLLNPTPGMPGMPQMNPMGWMGGMMQQPVEQAPQASAADMLTAVISAVGAIKEMSGGDDGDSKQMDRLLDKMDEMHKETEELKLKLIETQNKPSESLTTEDIRRIVVESMTGATSGKMGLLNGLQEIHAVSDELIGLGIVQKTSSGIDPEYALEERKFNHQVKLDDKREQRDHELNLRAEDAETAKANAKEAFISGLFAGAKENQVDPIDDELGGPVIGETVEVGPHKTAVIS